MTAQANTELPSFSDLEGQAATATMSTYGDLLQMIAVQSVSGVLDDIQRSAIISSLAANTDITAGVQVIKNALKKVEGDIRRDARQERTGSIAIINGHYCDYELTASGVLAIERKGDSGVRDHGYICGPIEVVALTRDPDSLGWGKLIEFRDQGGVVKRFVMASTLPQKDPNAAAAMLVDYGLWTRGAGVNKFVADYLSNASSDKFMRSVTKTGWHDGKAFIMQDKIYGAEDDYIFQGGLQSKHKKKGTLDGWRNGVAKLARGNSRAMFAINIGFSGPLMDMTGINAGGVQLTGETKDGKTLVCRGMASITGGPEDLDGEKQTWDNTGNALSYIASLHNHRALWLDELKRCAPKVVEKVIYALSDGKERGRLKSDAEMRTQRTWRLLWLSTGELSVNDHAAQAGFTPAAGVEVRQANTPSDAGKGLRIWDTIHDFEDEAAMNKAFYEVCCENHGVAWPVWIEWLIANRKELETRVEQMLTRKRAEILPNCRNPQVSDVLDRFALCAVGGELATEAGITGWEQGEATAAAKRCFHDWLDNFGVDDERGREHRQIVGAVQKFLNGNLHRFQNINLKAPIEEIKNMRDCVGAFDASDENQIVYHVFNTHIIEIAKGYSDDQIKKALAAEGMYKEPERDKYGKLKNQVTIPHRPRTRCLTISLKPEPDDD